MNMDELLFRILTGRATPKEEEELRSARSDATEKRRRILARILSLAAEADSHEAATTPPRSDELLAAGRRRSPLTPLRHRLSAPALTSRVRERLAWAAAVVLVIAASLIWRTDPFDRRFGVQEIATAADETVTVALREGTVVRLAPRSVLRVNERGSGREVSLSGRAYFAVARRENHPFRVRTPFGDVSVLGTRFELDSQTPDLRVTVVEGAVTVAVDETEERVEAGQIGRVMKGRPLPAETVDDPAATIDWLGNFLAFQSTPLGEAAREVERLYGVTVEIDDPALARRTVTSHFADWSLPDLIDALCLIVHASCSISGDEVRMEPR